MYIQDIFNYMYFLMKQKYVGLYIQVQYIPFGTHVPLVDLFPAMWTCKKILKKNSTVMYTMLWRRISLCEKQIIDQKFQISLLLHWLSLYCYHLFWKSRSKYEKQNYVTFRKHILEKDKFNDDTE